MNPSQTNQTTASTLYCPLNRVFFVNLVGNKVCPQLHQDPNCYIVKLANFSLYLLLFYTIILYNTRYTRITRAQVHHSRAERNGLSIETSSTQLRNSDIVRGIYVDCLRYTETRLQLYYRSK